MKFIELSKIFQTVFIKCFAPSFQDPDCHFLNNLEQAQMKALRKMVIDVVLATDMTKHLQHLGELKTMVETKKVANDGILILDKYSDRSEVTLSYYSQYTNASICACCIGSAVSGPLC